MELPFTPQKLPKVYLRGSSCDCVTLLSESIHIPQLHPAPFAEPRNYWYIQVFFQRPAAAAVAQRKGGSGEAVRASSTRTFLGFCRRVM